GRARCLRGRAVEVPAVELGVEGGSRRGGGEFGGGRHDERGRERSHGRGARGAPPAAGVAPRVLWFSSEFHRGSTPFRRSSCAADRGGRGALADAALADAALADV